MQLKAEVQISYSKSFSTLEMQLPSIKKIARDPFDGVIQRKDMDTFAVWHITTSMD